MESEILKLVQEKLPAIQAKALEAFIADARKTKDVLTITTRKLEDFERHYDRLSKLERDHKSIDVREDAILQREQKQNLLDCQLECEKEKVALAKELFTTVFRNIEIKRSLSGNVPVQSGQYGVAMGCFNKDETVSAE